MIKYFPLIIALAGCLNITAQEKDLKKEEKPPYNRKEEMIYDGKRYRIHNCYVSGGGGFSKSTIRNIAQKNVGIDFQFPIRHLHFQTGVMASGDAFGSDNNRQLHVGYGLRRETRLNNLAAYVGPTYFLGVRGDTTTGPPINYQGFGGYLCIQAVTKLTYDIGLGIELFTELSGTQSIFGFKIIAFFSGAYRGPKKNFNPNVRSENPK